MKLSIQMVDGHVFTLDVTPNTTIRQLKDKIDAEIGKEPDMYLTCGTKMLDSDEASLQQLNISELTTLNCSGRLIEGEVHGSLARVGKTGSQTPKVDKQKSFWVAKIVTGLSIFIGFFALAEHLLTRHELLLRFLFEVVVFFDMFALLWNSPLIITSGLALFGLFTLRPNLLTFYLIASKIQFFLSVPLSIIALIWIGILVVISGEVFICSGGALLILVHMCVYYFVFILPVSNSKKKMKQLNHLRNGGILSMSFELNSVGSFI